jgi:hypothetical protein
MRVEFKREGHPKASGRRDAWHSVWLRLRSLGIFLYTGHLGAAIIESRGPDCHRFMGQSGTFCCSAFERVEAILNTSHLVNHSDHLIAVAEFIVVPKVEHAVVALDDGGSRVHDGGLA